VLRQQLRRARRTSCCASGRRRRWASLLRLPGSSEDALLRRWPLRVWWPAAHLLPTRTLRLAPPQAAGEQGARPPQHNTPRLPPGQGRKSDVEPGGATFSWLHLLCGSRNGLQVRLLGWSRSICTCLAGLRVEPWLELELEPCQTGPKCFLTPIKTRFDSL
jgi:hypothetical protein